MKRLLLCAMTVSLVLALCGTGEADNEGTITVDQPTRNGEYVVDVWISGIVPVNNRVKVSGIKSTDTPAQKAQKVVVEINNAFGAPPAVATTDPANPAKILLKSPKDGKAGVAKLVSDKTGEASVIATVDVPPTTITAYIDYHGELAGRALDGGSSTFSSQFGYDTLSVSANLSYDTLSAPTIDGLLSDMYQALRSDLPLELQGDLHLDLGGDQIWFDFAGGHTNYFVQNSSTDVSVEVTGGIGVPEPAAITVLSVAIGLLGLRAHRAAAGRRRR